MTQAEAMSFGTLLRRLRLAAGLTQEGLAERAGVSAGAVSDLERNPTRLPRLDSVALLAEALGLDATERARFVAAARPEAAGTAVPEGTAATPQALPRPLTPLLGREGIAGAVTALLQHDEIRLLTLTGPGGIGKTRLAIEVAGRVATDFADGVVFVDLAPLRDPALVLPTIAQRLGLDERHAPALRDRLIALLRTKRLLLLLDNLEHLVAARDDILELLTACPRLAVLATSRAALRVRGEREYRVAPLELSNAADPPETLAQAAAVALFLERARDVGGAIAPERATLLAVAEICRRLDGLPLAIELAAAWARLLPPTALLARLERRLPLLVGGAHDLPERQRTMRDAIAWSYDLLTEEEQRLFRRLAVFAGGCTVEAAEAVDRGPETAPRLQPSVHGPRSTDTLATLAALIDRSLLRQQDDTPLGSEAPRLVLLETLREFGLERLEASGEAEALGRRHAGYFLGLAEAAEPVLSGARGREWGARLEREHDNLRTALRWILDSGEAEWGLRLTGALWQFWAARGHLSEGRRWLRAALEAPADATHNAPAVRGKALVGAAMLAIEQGSYGEAPDLCAEAVALARGRGERRELIAALNAQGLLAQGQGEYREAMRHHEEALALAEASGELTGEATALICLAYIATYDGEATQARALAERGLAAYHRLGDQRGLAEALMGLAWQATHTGDYRRTEALGTEALTLLRALGDAGKLANALFGLGVAAQFQGHADRAIVLHTEGLALRRERGDERGAVEIMSAIALIELQRGETQRARARFVEALAISERYDDRWARTMSLAQLAHVELAEGAVARAETLLVESAAIFHKLGNLLYASWCLEGLAEVAAARGEWDRAARLCGVRDADASSPLPPARPEAYARTLVNIRAALGEEAFAAAYAAGGRSAPEVALLEAASGAA